MCSVPCILQCTVLFWREDHPHDEVVGVERSACKRVREGHYPQDEVVGVERSLAIPEHPSLCSCLGVSIQGLKTWRSSLVS